MKSQNPDSRVTLSNGKGKNARHEMQMVNVPIEPRRPITKTASAASSRSRLENIKDPEDHFSLLPEPSVASSDGSFIFTVPPTTPAENFSFDYSLDYIPRPFPSLSNLKLPYIREVGIKTSIEILSVYFSCPNYKLNAVQFWFLDVITDCIWKMQDDFHFPEPYQKTIVEWVLQSVDLIRDPLKNLSRKEFFEIFNEAVTLAEEQVQAGCTMLPLPTDLFSLMEHAEEEEISFPSGLAESSTEAGPSAGASYVAVGIDESVEVFKLPKPPVKCYQYDISVDGSITETIDESVCGCEATVDFYQPDPNTPDRFLSSSSSYESLPGEGDDLPPKQRKFLWKPSSVKSDAVKKICFGDQVVTVDKVHPSSANSSVESLDPQNIITEEWMNYMDDRAELIEDLEKNVMINSCALFAIKQFVYDYFYETFQFTIVKLALINNFHSINQRINPKWNIPKILKEELKKPKPKKEKKKKKKKKKKPRKKTKKKKPKKKKKGKKKSKKSKKSKKKKLTKEEKEELRRLKREQERLEEELRRAEENRRMLFPLKDATDDDFFKSIFEHWVRPKEKKKKGKKGKKGKKKKK